jgi:hypothetical protein
VLYTLGILGVLSVHRRWRSKRSASVFR